MIRLLTEIGIIVLLLLPIISIVVLLIMLRISEELQNDDYFRNSLTKESIHVKI